MFGVSLACVCSMYPIWLGCMPVGNTLDEEILYRPAIGEAVPKCGPFDFSCFRELGQWHLLLLLLPGSHLSASLANLHMPNKGYASVKPCKTTQRLACSGATIRI